MSKFAFLKDYKVRKWLHGIGLAILLVLTGLGVLDAVTSNNLAVLISAILLVVPTATAGIAMKNARPSASDDVKEIETVIEDALAAKSASVYDDPTAEHISVG